MRVFSPLRLLWRKPLIRISSRLYASSSNIKIIIPTQKLIKKQTEYKQLPEDSRFVECYFEELKEFKKVLADDESHDNSTFTDYQNDPNALISELEKYVQTVIYPQYTNHADSLGEQLVLKRYHELLRDFKITLMINGGHPFVFDLLMSAQEALDKFDKEKTNKSNKKNL